MPCYYTGSELGDAQLDAKEAREQVTKLTQLLCMASGRLEKAGLLDKQYDPLRNWYKKHKETDEHRRGAARLARREARRKGRGSN